MTPEAVCQMMQESSRPAWSAKHIADYYDSTPPTARKRLDELHARGWVATFTIGKTTAYYPVSPADLGTVDGILQSLVKTFTDKFVGRLKNPWTAVHPDEGPATEGDRIQLVVTGTPDHWNRVETNPWSRRREHDTVETDADATQAVLSGDLYTDSTVPIEHVDYSDWDCLEAALGVKSLSIVDPETDSGQTDVLCVTGKKKHLLNACDIAVFLENISVDWVSPVRHERGESVDWQSGSEGEAGASGFDFEIFDDLDVTLPHKTRKQIPEGLKK
jgi:hypothetical protein